MKFSERYKEKILNKSHKYNFYKEGYENLVEVNDKLKSEISNLNNLINSHEINEKKEEFDFKNFLINSYFSPFINAPFSENQIKYFQLMDLIGSYLSSKVDSLNNKPLVSVIMPVYNRKDIILNSIESVLSQSYENFELIIVDDASTDGTTELLKNINNDKIDVYYHEKNKDASGARNTALENVNGDYIAYLDSDNTFDNDYLKASIGAFFEFPDASAIYSAQKRYDFHDSNLNQVLFGHFNKSLLYNQNYIDINCFVHKKNVIDDVCGFDEELLIGEDWDLILKISKYHKIYSIPFLLSNYYLKVANNRKLITTPSNREKIYKNNGNLQCYDNELTKKVSIIIPIYKNHVNLEKCVCSVLALQLDNIEIILSNMDSNISIQKFNHDSIKYVGKNEDYGFSDAINKGLSIADNNSDILILNQNAILTYGSIELMQKYAYCLSNCGLIVSNKLIKDSLLIKDYAPHAHEDCWLDVMPYGNILNIPIFFNGEILELKHSPFFCTYLKREVFDSIRDVSFNFKSSEDYMHILSEYVKKVLNLKIYHVSEANVINNVV